MRNITVAAIQMACFNDPLKSIEKANALTREAIEKGANLILLPELFERRYFCQERRYDYYSFAKPVEENDAVIHFTEVSKKTGTVIPVSFYEKAGNVLYNSIAVIDSGKLLGVYRKTHIPDDHFYQEKFYFTPGNTGFKVWDTRFGKIGIGICWDQWFPETARSLVINGSELLLFPTAIGSEPILNTDSKPHWQRTMTGHAAANIVPVIASNRIGKEDVFPSSENGNQSSSLLFYGSSFITDMTGDILKEASRDKEEVLIQTFDLDEINTARLEWGLMRDRRPECYKEIVE